MSYARTNFGRTVSSSLYKLSDSLWLLEVRNNVRNLVEYIAHNDSYNMPIKLDSEQLQTEIFGKVIQERTLLTKLKQAAVAIARIKNEYPYMINQLKHSGDKIFNSSALHVIFFRQDERIWHVPDVNKQRKHIPVSSFVLLVPSLSRVMSFETPEENLVFEQFQFGTVEKVQVQGAFSKVRRNMGGKTSEYKILFTEFMHLKFIFRTIEDAKKIYNAKRLENFSFITTSEADENSFKIAFYFLMVGKVVAYSHFSVGSGIPANVVKIKLVDRTGEQEFQMVSDLLNEKIDALRDGILSFFQLTDELEKENLKKNSFVVALARWSVGDDMPEILYLKKLGEIPDKNRLEAFDMLAFLNSRKKMPIQTLRDRFPEASKNEEHFIVDEGYAYLMQFDWEKELFKEILAKSKKTGDFSFIDPGFPIGLYFYINYDARKLYLSRNPEKDFEEIFNVNSYPSKVKKNYKYKKFSCSHGRGKKRSRHKFIHEFGAGCNCMFCGKSNQIT